jgi:hypothetical protein
MLFEDEVLDVFLVEIKSSCLVRRDASFLETSFWDNSIVAIKDDDSFAVHQAWTVAAI